MQRKWLKWSGANGSNRQHLRSASGLSKGISQHHSRRGNRTPQQSLQMEWTNFVLASSTKKLSICFLSEFHPSPLLTSIVPWVFILRTSRDGHPIQTSSLIASYCRRSCAQLRQRHNSAFLKQAFIIKPAICYEAAHCFIFFPCFYLQLYQ